MVMFTGFADPVYDPEPDPVHPLNANPLFGVALICTDCDWLYQPLGGETVPPAPACVVSQCWAVKFAWYIEKPDGVMTCEIDPPSFQLWYKYRVRFPLDCGVVVAMVCAEPGVQSKACWLAYVVPSTLNDLPGGTVSTTTRTGGVWGMSQPIQVPQLIVLFFAYSPATQTGPAASGLIPV
jgi:hypothetical protein